MMMKPLLALCALLALAACDKKPEEKKSGPPPTLITVTQVKSGAFEVTEDTLGTVEAVNDPKIGAEVAGKVAQVTAFAGKAVKAGETLAIIDSGDVALQYRADEAEARRLELLAGRQLELVEKGFLSKTAGESATAQRDVARARADISRRSVGKTTVKAPFDGVVENQLVAAGTYVKVGDPMFLLVSNKRLRAHLPFPESAAPRLSRGQVVKLTSPQMPGKVFEAKIADIRPAISESSRALDVIVEIDGNGTLKSGGTVNASVQIAAKDAALIVPEQSVVLRPAGKVVYAITEEDGKKKAIQRIVQTGAKKGGVIEIISGLKEGESVAQDGAGFLTNGATVAVKEPKKDKVGAGNTPKGAPGAKPEGTKSGGAEKPAEAPAAKAEVK